MGLLENLSKMVSPEKAMFEKTTGLNFNAEVKKYKEMYKNSSDDALRMYYTPLKNDRSPDNQAKKQALRELMRERGICC